MLSYRPHTTIFWQALLVLLTFTACVNDDLIGDGDANGKDGSAKGNSYQLILKINSVHNGAQTRAEGDPVNGDYIYGNDREQQIGSSGNFIIFFDKNRKLIEENPLQEFTGLTYVATDNYIEAGYTTTISLDEDKEAPKWCLVVLNGKPVYDMLQAGINNKSITTIEDVLNQEWSGSSSIGFNNEGLFTMTNSIYAVPDTVKGSNKDILATAVEIKPEHLEKGSDKEILNVYVERMVSKVTLEVPNEERIYYPVEPEDKNIPAADPLIFFDGLSEDGSIEFVSAKKWRIKLTGWGVNGVESQNYIFKKVDPNATYYGTWNAPTRFRSYWSEDLNYETGRYPWQYRSAVESPELVYYSNKGDYHTLTNFSYDDFVAQTFPSNNGGEPVDLFNRAAYAPENTYGDNVIKQDLDSRTNLLAGTHLIITAQLEVDLKESADGTGFTDGDWYRDRSGVYHKSEADCFISAMHSFNQTLESQENMNYRHYDWSGVKGLLGEWTIKPCELGKDTVYMIHYYDDGQEKPLTGEILSKLYDDYNEEKDQNHFINLYGPMATGNILHGDGKLLPWFEDEKGKLLISIKPYIISQERTLNDPEYQLKVFHKDEVKPKIVVGDDGKPELDSNGNPVINGWIIEKGEPRDDEDGPYLTDNDIRSLLFEWEGAIDHFRGGKMYYSAPMLHNGAGKEKPNQKTLGDYGMVRNNWYQFKLKNVSGIGTPIDRPEDPIVPDHLEVNDVINVAIDILPWHYFGYGDDNYEGQVPAL